MVRGRDYDDMARQSIDLKQKTRNDTLYFTCLVHITPFFSHDVELVEEQYARDAPNMIEQAAKALRRLTKEAPD